MTKLEKMMLLIKWEYEQTELKEYKPKKFETYLLEKLADIRLSKKYLQEGLSK